MTGARECQPEAAALRQHTPTPWMTQPCGELLPDDVMIVADMGKTDNGIQKISTVARVLSVRQTKEVTKLNAAFIVEAVNNHDRLTERCEAYKGQVEAGAAEIAALKSRVEELTNLARFLVDRLQEFDPGDFEAERDFHGHVAPAIARLTSAISLEDR